jgi:hypothetical protein
MPLACGHHLFPTPEGHWLLYGPEDRFARLNADPALVARLAALLAKPVPVRAAIAREPDAEALANLLGQFERRDLVVAAEEPADLAGRQVEVRGEGPVAAALAGMLRSLGVGVREVPDGAPFAAADLVVACAGWLPDSLWQELDAWCAGRRIPWHSCYAEGLRFYLGPLALSGETAGYRDTRARRLAASPNPRELELYWRYLDGRRGLPAVPWPRAGGVAALAGALATDVIAVLRGEAPPSAGYQIAFDPGAFAWRRHPVLPVPRVLEAAP